MDKAAILSNQYSKIRYICYELIHFQSDFENDFLIKSDKDKETFEALKELFKNLQDDAFTVADLIYEMMDEGKGGD